MDVWVLGRIGYDLYAVEQNVPLPEVKTFTRHLGGSRANIAVGLARLGVEVGIISAVGDDLMADMPHFCHFWRYTADAFRAMDHRDYAAMAAYQREVERQADERLKGAAHG